MRPDRSTKDSSVNGDSRRNGESDISAQIKEIPRG